MIPPLQAQAPVDVPVDYADRVGRGNHPAEGRKVACDDLLHGHSHSAAAAGSRGERFGQSITKVGTIRSSMRITAPLGRRRRARYG
jgi:hypothetical protein